MRHLSPTTEHGPPRPPAPSRTLTPVTVAVAIAATVILLGSLFLQLTKTDPSRELFAEAASLTAQNGPLAGNGVDDGRAAAAPSAGITDADAIYPSSPTPTTHPQETVPTSGPASTAVPPEAPTSQSTTPSTTRSTTRSTGGPAPARTATSRDRAVAAVAGKGQYLYRWEKIGTPAHVVAEATARGLSHLVVRAGNPVQGFYVRDVLADLLPRAHAAGIKVVAYDGPALEDIAGDVARAMEIVNYTAPSGDRIDAFAADIERSRAPNLDGPRAHGYATGLRAAVGVDYPLVAIVYNPNYHLDWYPFAELATSFDVFSPMDYWTGRTDDGAAFVRRSIELLAPFGLPVSPIGQAYPIEQKGTYPPPDRVRDAMQAAKDAGAVGMSFWSWETTQPDTWQVIGDFAW